ncbi:MAG: peptidase [Brachybacterium sp.]|nr:peptidase [Brachybacterium sp.]
MSPRGIRLGPLPPVQVSGGTLVTIGLLAVIVHPAIAATAGSTAAGALALSVGIAMFLILSVLLHEIAHAVAARGFGARVHHIALNLWGGHTQYSGGRTGAIPSIVISLVGPGTNALIGVLCAFGAGFAEPGGAAAIFLGYGSTLNYALAVFNLLPGLPMDGGRALEGMLGAVLRDRRTGTVVTAWIGRAIAVAVVVLAFLLVWRSGYPGVLILVLVWAMIIAGTLWHGATTALRAAATEKRLETLDLRRVAHPVVLLPADGTVGDIPPGVEPPHILAVDADGRAARLDADALAHVASRSLVPLSAVTGPPLRIGSVTADRPARETIEALIDQDAQVLLLRDAAGQVLGTITVGDVESALRHR